MGDLLYASLYYGRSSDLNLEVILQEIILCEIIPRVAISYVFCYESLEVIT